MDDKASMIFLRLLPIFLVTLCTRHSQSLGIVYMPSDAYKESMLRPYNYYSDVVIFHFSIPPQTLRAVWQFAAFMDDYSCIAQTVHISLRHGSYPVLSPDNSSFPSSMHVPSDEMHSMQITTIYQPRQMSELFILNPLPGSWFAVAFVPEWNHKIEPEGINHKCHYSLGCVAAWNHQPDVLLLTPSVPVNVTPIGQNSYFKVFVPEDTWLLEVSITSCWSYNISSHETESIPFCIQKFGIRAHAFPFLEKLNVSHSDDSLVRTILHPETDTYYYIQIQSVPNIVFTLTTYLKACSLTWHHSKRQHKIRVSGDYPSKFFSVLEWIQGQSSAHCPRVNLLDFKIWLADWESEKGCFPVITLTRISHAQNFLNSFLIQGHNWFSSWVGVTDLLPVVLKFELLPYVDIGGTLQTKIHIDSLNQNLTMRLFQLNACISHGHPILHYQNSSSCPPELLMTVVANSNATAVKYFPYPLPGKWFLSLTLTCYNSSDMTPEPCEMEQVLVDLRIRLQPCVFEGQPCGEYGYCKETHFRQFFFSYCHCLPGWKGWGCTDNTESSASSLLLLQTLLLTLSNLFLLPAAVVAGKRKLYTEAVVYIITMIFSMFYHACDAEAYRFCVAKYEVLQFCDFYSALVSFWVTLIAMANLSPPLTSVAHMVGALGIALGVEYQRTGFLVFMIPAGIGMVVILLSWGFKCYNSQMCYPARIKWLLNLFPGIALASTGLILFAFVETDENYKYVHSCWHVVIALSVIFLLPLKEKIHTSYCSSFRSEDQPEQDIVFNNLSVASVSEMADISEYHLNSDIQALVGEPRY